MEHQLSRPLAQLQLQVQALALLPQLLVERPLVLPQLLRLQELLLHRYYLLTQLQVVSLIRRWQQQQHLVTLSCWVLCLSCWSAVRACVLLRQPEQQLLPLLLLHWLQPLLLPGQHVSGALLSPWHAPQA
jgi:hypothetical protein